MGLKPLEAIPTGAMPSIKNLKPKAVIFDIYGTLLISASGDVDKAEYNSQMMLNALEAAEILVLDKSASALDRIYAIYQDCLKQHYEQGRREGRPFPEVNIIVVWEDTLRLATQEQLIVWTEDTDLKLFIFVFELQTNKVWPMPGMQDLIRRLASAGVEVGIVSNAQFYTPVILNHFLYDIAKEGPTVAPFQPDLSIYSYQYLRGKPDVALYENLLPGLAKHGLAPKEVMFVGNDMLKDMYCATELGMQTAFFAGDKRAYRLHGEDERTSHLKPDVVITELNHLLEVLGIA